MNRMAPMNRMALLAAVIAGSLATLPLASFADAQTSCGGKTTLTAGETLADVAERCDVTVDALMEANPDLPVGAIPAGTEIDLPGLFGGDFLGRARNAVGQAGREVEDAAKRAGKSVSDYLSDNPDLNRDILKFGERLGLPGVKAPAPEIGADITVSPASGRSGDEVVVRVSGLRGESDVAIGAGLPGAKFEVLKRAKTTAAGRLEVTVTIPPWAAEQSSLVFVAETDRVRLTSEPVVIADK